MKVALISAALATISLPAQPAHLACADRDAALAYLNNKYSEKPMARGLANNGSVFEVVSSDNGSWTILLTRPDGVTCIIATGQNWESTVPPVILGKPS